MDDFGLEVAKIEVFALPLGEKWVVEEGNGKFNCSSLRPREFFYAIVGSQYIPPENEIF